jgi:peptidoglycan/LPS O-acetylase OafA/YrhL
MNPVFDRQSGSPRLWKGVLLPAGIAVLLLTFLYRAPWFRETIRYSLQGLALTPVFVAAIRFPTWLPFRLLNARPVAFVGVLSYTLYLVHQVVLYGLALHFSGAGQVLTAVSALMVSFGVAYAVHVVVERPSARLRSRLGRAPVGRIAVAG